MNKVVAIFACVIVASAQMPAIASSFPDKPITIIVPFPAGGVTDTLTRMVARSMSDNLGVPVVVDNRPGVGGSLGMELLKKAPANGYTLGVTSNGNMAANLFLYEKINYSPTEDFDHISIMFTVPYVLISSQSSSIKTVSQLVSQAKSKPLSMSNGGYGTAVHLMAESFAKAIGVDITHIPYKGEAPAVLDVLGGHVELGISSFSSISEHIKSKKINAIAVTSPQRMAALPDVPTLKELGIQQEVTGAWFGLAAPRNLAPDVFSVLAKSISTSVRSAEAYAKVEEIGGVVMDFSPDRSRQYVGAEIPRWKSVVQSINLKKQ